MKLNEAQALLLSTEKSLEDYLYQMKLSEPTINRIFEKIAIVEAMAVEMGRMHEQNKRPAPIVPNTKQERAMKLRERADKWQREYVNLKKRYDRLGVSYDGMKVEIERKNREIEHLKKVLERLG